MTSENKPGAPSPEEMAAEGERQLGRAMALGVPALTVLGTAAVWVTSSAGPAILVLASGTLLGAIALLWASVRTLTGDAPLPQELEHLTFHAAADTLAQRKAMLLRALRDLDAERSLGKIDEADFASISERYREEIKQIMREMDAQIEAHVARAEELARAHLARIGLAGDPFRAMGKVDQAKDEALAKDDALSEPFRVDCKACGASNERDARFCKACGGLVAGPAAPAPQEGPSPQEARDEA